MYKYLRHFNYAIPEAFIDSLTNCSFDAGDMLYSNKTGYQSWQSADPETVCIQVQSSATSTGADSENKDSKLIFEDNWFKTVEVDIFAISNISSKETFSVSAGNLFSQIWKGNGLEHAETLPLPTFPTSIKPAELNKLSIKTILNLESEEKVFAIPYCDLNQVLYTKAKKLRNTLSGKQLLVGEKDIELDIYGIEDTEQYLPTTAIKCFIMKRVDDEIIIPLLTKELKTKNKKQTKKSKFKLSNHGLLI